MKQNKIAVVVDSSANLSEQEIQKYHIKVVNQPVMFGKHVYRENIDLNADEFYRMMKLEKTHPTNSQISMKQMQIVFKNLAIQGYEAVLCVGLSGGLSGFINSVSASIPTIKDLTVYTFDSGSILSGTGHMAMLASQLLADGVNIHEVLEQLRKYRSKTQVYIALNNVRELQNSATFLTRTSLVNSFFGMRPIVTINKKGRLEMIGKERQMKNAMEEIQDIFQANVSEVDQYVVTVIYANDVDRSEKWQSELELTYPQLRVESCQIGPYIGAFTGRHAIGLIWSPKL